MKKVLSLSILFLLLISNLVVCLEIKTNIDQDFPNVQPTGYLRVRYTIDETKGNVDGFTISASRFGLKGSLSKKCTFAFSVEKTNTDTANNKELYDTYIDLVANPLTKVRIGQYKYRFGLEQTTADADLETINKAYVVDNLVKPTRDIGFELSGIFLQKFNDLNYSVSFLNGSGSNQSDENQRKSVILRTLYNNVTKGLNLGVSVYDGETGVTNAMTKKDRMGFEAKYEFEKFVWKAEYVSGKDATTKKNGFYITKLYSILPQVVLLLRYDAWDPNTKVSGDNSSRWTLGGNYFIDKNILIRTNYERKNEKPKVKNDLFMTQLQVKF